MKTAAVVAGVALVALVVFVATRGSSSSAPVSGDGPSSSLSGVVRSVGAGLTGIVGAIVGAVEAEETAGAEERTAEDAQAGLGRALDDPSGAR